MVWEPFSEFQAGRASTERFGLNRIASRGYGVGGLLFRTLACAAAFSTLGCIDEVSRGGDPGGPELLQWQSETSIATRGTGPAGTDIIVAYQDETRFHSSTNPFPDSSQASISTDQGVTWKRMQMPTVDPTTCIANGGTNCIGLIFGDPWLSQSKDIILWTALGQRYPFVGGVGGSTDLIVFTTLAPGSQTWADWQVLTPGFNLDKDSNDFVGDVAIAVWDDQNRLAVSSSSDGSAQAWSSPQFFQVTDTANQLLGNPIVRLVNSNLAYVAYEVRNPSVADNLQRVTRLTRPDAGSQWAQETIFENEAITDSDLLGANGLFYKDWDAMGFSTSRADAPELWIAYASKFATSSIGQAVVGYHCDTAHNLCGRTSEGNVGWDSVFFAAPAPVSYHQPNVIVSDDGSNVRFTWYRQNVAVTGTTADPIAIEAEGVSSTSHGAPGTFSPRPIALPGNVTFDFQPAYEPCPDARENFGDYFASGFLPGAIDSNTGYQLAVTAWADSKYGCLTGLPNNEVFDQHVQGEVW